MFTPLLDTSPMPFGEHRSKRMSDVPAAYLDWAYGQSWLFQSYPAVADYIKRNRKAIDWELKREEDSRAEISNSETDET